jgi:hypothetical protein
MASSSLEGESSGKTAMPLRSLAVEGRFVHNAAGGQQQSFALHFNDPSGDS